MDTERYEREIRRWTAEAARDLDRTRRVALLWAWFAIAAVPVAIGFSLLVTLIGFGLTAAGVFMFNPFLLIFGVPMLVGGGSVTWELVRAMTVRGGADPGVRADRRELPELWARIDRLAAQVGVAPPNELIIESGFAAYAGTRVPRPLSRSVDVVGLGLATIAMLEEDELDAILVHELAHLRGRDTSATRRVRRALAMWYRIDDAIGRRQWKAEQPDSGRIAGCSWAIMRCTVLPTARVLGPRLPAIDKAIGREQELAADRAAAATMGAEANARVLLKCAARLPVWSRQRDATYEAALLASPTPARDLPVRAAQLAAEPLAPWEVRLNVAHGLNEPDSIHDEHPALNRRLVMLGIGVDRPATRTVTFDEAAHWAGSQPSGALWASTFTGAGATRVLDRVGAQWTAGMGTSWSEAHAERVKFDAEARALAARPVAELSAADCMRVAWLYRIASGREAARAWLGQAVQSDPRHFDAAFSLGMSLSAAGDQHGPAWLAHARSIAPERAPEVLEWTAAWHRACGDLAGSEALMAQVDGAVAHLRTAKTTPWAVRVEAPVVDRAPTARECAIIEMVCAKHPGVVARVRVARLKVPHPPHGHLPLTVVFETRESLTQAETDRWADRFVGELSEHCFSTDMDQRHVYVTKIVGAPPAELARIVAAPATIAWSAETARASSLAQVPHAA